MRDFKNIVEDVHVSNVNGNNNYMTGTFRFRNGKFASFVCGRNEDGYDHVSVAPYQKSYTPSWEDMCQVKEIFWRDNEEVYEIHPPKSEYVNVMENCLHLWALTNGKRLGALI